MEEKITYLLGAGASANVLPLIKNGKKLNQIGLPTALQEFIDKRKDEIIGASRWEEGDFDKLSNVVKKCILFSTPDLAAKYYLEKDEQENYSLLKKLLSFFFHVTENAEEFKSNGFEGKTLDPRVVPFLTTITHKKRLPDKLKILSWNYDSQIEKGAGILYSNKDRNDLNFNVWPFKKNEYDSLEKDYFLLHLNGVCGSFYSDKHLAMENPYLLDFNRKLEPLLSFAWEDDDSFKKKDFTSKRLPLAKNMIEKSTILVVIGYSFPFFNRKIDAELFSFVKPTLRKIYFQDPNLDGKFLYNQFGLLDENLAKEIGYISPVGDIVHIKEVDQYYVPYEL